MIDIQIGDQIEYREDGLKRHTVYSVTKSTDDIFVNARKEKANDTDGYSAFYWSQHGKSVKVIKHKNYKTNFSTRELKKEKYHQLSLFD